MYDIITFGSAALDIFLKPSDFKIIKDKKKFITEKGICFNLGSKVDVENIFFFSGGGGTNTAATFSKQGYNVAFCGRVGDDFAGQQIINELKDLNISCDFVSRTKEKPTNTSVVLSGLADDRTIFVYRGASEILTKQDIPWQGLKAKWFYLAPLSGKLSEVFDYIIDFASQNNIKVAVNPGNTQLSYPIEKLAKILKKVDILILNEEEASLLTGIPLYEKNETRAPILKKIGARPSTQSAESGMSALVFKKIDEICPGIAIMTKGQEGVVVSDGKYIYKSKAQDIKIVDGTGAGDSFASGFLSEYIRTNDIEQSIQLGIANSASCLKKWGAKNGLLEKEEKFPKTDIRKEECKENNICKTKSNNSK